MKKTLALACVCLLLSSCAGAPPPKRFTGDRQTAPIRSLSVALLVPRIIEMNFNETSLREMAKSNSQTGFAKMAGAHVPSAFRVLLESVYDPDRLYRGTQQVFYQDFKSVILVQSIDDPRVAGADLIAVPEMTYTIRPPSQGKIVLSVLFPYLIGMFITPLATRVQLDMTTVFYSPDRSIVATIKAQTVQMTKRRPAAFPPKLDGLFAQLHQALAAELDTALETSPELAQYARSLDSKRIAVAAPARQDKRPAKVYESDVDRPAYSLDENADNYAIVIGVESYQNLGAAKFAKRDAETVKAHLRALGYPGQNIALLTDAQATGSKISSYVESWLPRNVKPASKVFFYFSGHGAPDSESKRGYLMPWDGDPQFVGDSGYSLERLYQQLGGLQVKQAVVAMDSGFSGAGGRSVLAKGARPLVGAVSTAPAGSGKLIVLSAAGSAEVTGEDEDQGHGLFTYHFLKALNDKAGQGNLAQLHGILKPRLAEAARKTDRDQTAQLEGAKPDEAFLR